jgi:excisionase family DNA binding protein
MDTRLLLRVEEAAAALGISRALLYRDLLQPGTLRVVKIAGRTLIPVAELERYVRERTSEATAPDRGQHDPH